MFYLIITGVCDDMRRKLFLAVAHVCVACPPLPPYRLPWLHKRSFTALHGVLSDCGEWEPHIST